MLNIPEEVKQLFRQGSVRKNIRIHFPNGEREDITNSNLISESFSFTESICSQDTLKFGLCEASMVEFDTFGVGNIKGCTIEVTLEVPYNGEAYSITIGTFVVDSCKKQTNLGRRNVVAYSKDFDFGKLKSFEMEKRRIMRGRKYYDYDVFKYIVSNYFPGNELFFEKELLTTKESGFNNANYEIYRNYIFTWDISTKVYYLDSEEKEESLYYINNFMDEKKEREIIEQISIILEKWFTYAGLSINATNERIKKYINEIKKDIHPYVGRNYGYAMAWMTDDSKFIYPYPIRYDLVDDGSSLDNFGIVFPYAINLRFYKKDSSYYETIPINFVENPEIYLVDTSSWRQYTNIEKGDVYKNLPNGRELTESYIELNGLLGKIGREGAVDLISLKPKLNLYPSETLYPADNLYPRGERENLLTKSMYKHPLWYDDTYTLPYSKVLCTYKNSETNEDTLAEYDIVEVEEGEESNYQTYDLSDNYLIKSNTFTEDEITAILEIFASNVEGIKYMPAEINTVNAFPYLEAGDVVQVITTDGGFETIILNRTLSGIQSLSDSYESRG